MNYGREVGSFVDSIENYLEYNVFNFATDKAMSLIKHYGRHIHVGQNNNYDNKMDIIVHFLEKYDDKFTRKIINAQKVNYKRLLKFTDDGKDSYIYVTISNAKKSTVNLSDFIVVKSYTSDSRDRDEGRATPTVDMYFTGKGCLKYYNAIQTEIENLKDNLYIYNVSGASNEDADERGGRSGNRMEFNSITTDLIPRSMNTLFFDDDVQGTIENYIDKFLSNYPIYKDRNLLFKTGLLLYGIPGTGKSSLAKAIASYYNCSMVIVDINSFETLDTNILTTCINGDDYRYVVLFEDIDTIFNSLDRETGGDDVRKNKVINKLLQLLDSNNSPNNVIFIATTNHIEKLDEAILREGRFDLKVEVKPINTEDAAAEMCRSFNLSDATINKIVKEEIEYPIKQSKLQNIILSHIENVSVDKIKTTQEEEE